MPTPAPTPWSTREVSVIADEVEVLAIDGLRQERGGRFTAHTGLDPHASATPYLPFRTASRAAGRSAASAGGTRRREPVVPRAEAEEKRTYCSNFGWIEPGDTDGDREGGPARQMETP
ncbi:hypothetical protein [Streptomyces sp. NBC_01727]|uniref:hypothetical protein n=1 Tax=Streptomyces sp. NBC_01727 TaxID=2975924 RepID=UPI002E12D831|nr:hypothetical protein OIE76_22050 [Streptomyces sp. NBC_01727]